jgi:hypothetical protein
MKEYVVYSEGAVRKDFRGFPMKMNGQSRAFAKQVQVDLLALSDDDLLHTIHHWVDGRNPSGLSLDVPEDTRLALGYTHVIAETERLPNLHNDVPGVESESSAPWRAPSSHQLRTLITAMDVHTFAQHVIPLAFQSLHTIYPEWYEGVTFNAHLANYLRQISMKRRTMSKEQSIGT